MRNISFFILPAMLAVSALLVAGRQDKARRTTDFRDAPNGVSAFGSLDATAGGAEAGSYAVPVPGAPDGSGAGKKEPGAVSPQVEKFISQNGDDFDSYEASCASLAACKLEDGYTLHEKIYAAKGEVSAVFRAFVTQSPKDAWNGTSRFELLYDRYTKRKYTRASEEIPAIRTGQLFFLTLSLPLGLKIPVVFEIVNNDAEKHEFAFSYVKTNKSNGIQAISFRQNGDSVEITHTTHYKSGSEFRDKHVYAKFHESLTDDFYENFFSSLSKAD